MDCNFVPPKVLIPAKYFTAGLLCMWVCRVTSPLFVRVLLLDFVFGALDDLRRYLLQLGVFQRLWPENSAAVF
jgi:hypothetical protein